MASGFSFRPAASVASWLVLCDQLDLCLLLSSKQVMQHKSLTKRVVDWPESRQAEPLADRETNRQPMISIMRTQVCSGQRMSPPGVTAVAESMPLLVRLVRLVNQLCRRRAPGTPT